MADVLTPEQTELLEQFVDITSWEQDRAVAVRLLQSSGWKLETALQLHFEGVDVSEQGNQSAPSPPSQPPSERLSSSASNVRTSLFEELHAQQPEQDLAPQVNPQTPVYSSGHTSLSIIQTVLFAPLTIGYKLLNSILYWVSIMFPFLPRWTGYYPANRNATRAGNVVDPRATAARYIQNFEERYGENEIPWFEGGYTEALERAKTGLHYLVVVLTSSEHDLTDGLNRNVLLNREVVEFLKRDDIMLWAGDVKESEAYLVASGLEVTKFPFVALIAPSPKTPTSNVLVMTVLERLRGVFDADTFISIIEERMEEHRPKLMSLILDKQERDMDRQLREEQASAYERSLRADQEREERNRQEAQRQQELVEEQRRQEEEAERKRKEDQEREETLTRRKELWKRWRMGQLAPEPTKADRCGNVSLRWQSGERVVRGFDANATLEDIYAFAECYDLIKNNVEPLSAKPEGYTHEYKFEIVSPMPRKVLPATDVLVKEEPLACPNGSFIVEAIVEEEEGDEDYEE